MSVRIAARRTLHRAHSERVTSSLGSQRGAPARFGFSRVQRAVGNRGMHRLLSAPAIQPKHTTGTDADSPEVSSELESYLATSRGGGQPLADAARHDFEPRFGHDFGDVRVHTDARAADSTRALNAQAYAIGHDIVFAQGQYAPATDAGRRLIAHELTHVIQQGHTVAPGSANQRQTSNLGSPLVQQSPDAVQTIRRQKDNPPPSQAKKTNLYFVIGDAKLNVGGGVVLKNLEAMRAQLLKTSMAGEWTLTMTMHGADTFFGLTAGDVTGGLKENDPKAYNKAKIEAVFGDAKFQAWREKHGPTRINLLSCQIGSDLEAAFLKLLLQSSSTQRAVGLGRGCILYNTAIEATIDDKHIKTRKQYKSLIEPDQQSVQKTLTELNDKYGYNGKKLAATDILDYYFDVAPEGLWMVVEVLTKQGSRIPSLARQSNTTFITECDPSSPRQRQPRVPTVP